MKFFSFVAVALMASMCQGQNIVEVLQQEGQTTILQLLELTGLTAEFEHNGEKTVFLPKQEVFDSLPAEVVEAITADVDLLTEVLLYHTVHGKHESVHLHNDQLLNTLQGEGLRVNVYDVAGETVVTVAGVAVDLSRVDIIADNGIIHFLDFVILNIPVGDSIETLEVVEGYTFEALLYAIESAGLVETIANGTDISVLAPIDSEAFSVAIVDSLLADPEALTAILLDHVASEVIFSAGVGASREITTVGGNTLVIQYTEEKGYVVTDVDGNELADIIAGDIPTTQGVLHIIDRPIVL